MPPLRHEAPVATLPPLHAPTVTLLHHVTGHGRWLLKIAEAVHHGQLEKIRQSGLYLDTDSQFTVISTPAEVTRLDAERWIWAATRVLNLLEKGTYYQSYSPLAELMSAANAGDEEAARMLEIVKSMAD